ncbi:uncharacterized protein LOC121376794 [Gigantopelta aegis]|uniref:uncharacterized protein LOC121376794 n=1 Tax=Gigantopelta aegis TaxID=1735272 RepID=UPI001B88878C|nr:uncharacterized protein LOC121376794 [Gigantopelta aegis]
MDLFNEMKKDGYFTVDKLDKDLVRFCFLRLIQVDIDKVVEVWNSHKIRRSRFNGLQNATPAVLYCLPHLHGYTDCLCQVEPLDIEVSCDEILDERETPCDEDVYELCTILMDENNLSPARDAYAAVDMYIELRTEIKRVL